MIISSNLATGENMNRGTYEHVIRSGQLDLGTNAVAFVGRFTGRGAASSQSGVSPGRRGRFNGSLAAWLSLGQRSVETPVADLAIPRGAHAPRTWARIARYSGGKWE